MDLEKIITVLVLYKSSLKESESFQSLLRLINLFNHKLTLLVYNNSPDYWEYRNEQYPGFEIIYIADSENSGVSKAYNIAYTYSKKIKKKYILLLDQDTSLPQSYFNVFFDCEKNNGNFNVKLYCPMVVNADKLLSPAKFFLFSSRRLNFITSGIHTLKGLAIINSGLIISVELFESVGGYNEKIKLDFSDFDFLKRSGKFTDKIWVLDIKCQHELSAENRVSMKSALTRFDYYLKGAIYCKKSMATTMGLYMRVFLRSIKLNIRYKTISFTRKIFVLVFKG